MTTMWNPETPTTTTWTKTRPRSLTARTTTSSTTASSSTSVDIEMVQSESFISTQGWESDKVVDYRINEEEFHKISLLNCDFFIRKPPDPDDNMYDFREEWRLGNDSKVEFDITSST
ncbi:hypothetical protein AAC387_Pa11g2016 [Persea americana]